ncbi:MAG: hypothetical protein ACI9U2_000739 [Bradymonadia bacterium]|jgi:hypothetical protein
MRRTATEALIKQVLGDDYTLLDIVHYQLSEEIGDPGGTAVSLRLRHAGGDIDIAGKGVGFIEGACQGLIAHYTKEYQSLRTIQFTGFEVTGKMDTGQNQGLDAEALVTLTVQNSAGHSFVFMAEGRSTVACSLEAVVGAVEFFVNSERAFRRVHAALVDARSRNRADLIQSYTAKLAELVKTTSYSEVIERIRRESL